ncbi:unnamed protein product [Caretta caretta]
MCLTARTEITSPENENLQKKISGLQLSRHTVERRISDLNSDIESQLHLKLQQCEYLSIALDESCDVQDKPQLSVFVHTVSDDCVVREELLDIVPLKDRTCGRDMKEALMLLVAKHYFPLQKLTAIATDGAPSVWGSVNGLVGLCKSDESLPELWTFHCIIHWEQLVSKSLKFDHVTKPVLHIVNFIHSNALNHRQFQNLIEELDEDDFPDDLPFHCAV